MDKDILNQKIQEAFHEGFIAALRNIESALEKSGADSILINKERINIMINSINKEIDKKL